jgi:hypothetical protein
MVSRTSRPPTTKTYLSILALALLAAGIPLTLLARNSGYSPTRLLLVGIDLLLAVAAAGAALLLHQKPQRAGAMRDYLASPGRNRRLRLGISFAFLVFWSLTWLPPQYTGDAYYYFVGLYPLVLCGLLASGLALIHLTAAAGGLSAKAMLEYVRQHKVTFTAMLACLSVSLVLAIFIRVGHILQNNEPFWRGAGVPLLGLQVLAALFFGVLLVQFDNRLPRGPIRLNLILFLLIWAIAAVLWSRQPIGESFWVTGPRAPNQEYYPFSDLETFDLGSQFALIGQGIFNRQFWDRALYMSFLVYLHSVGGQDYQEVMSIQAALFAIMPALLFLLGTKLHGRNAGLVIAVLTIQRGLNSLTAAPYIHSSTFKHMLTDFPTGIGLAAFVLLLLHWLESPNSRRGAVLWAAGILGLTSLLRPHVLTLLPIVLILVLFVERRRFGSRLLMPSLSLIAFLAATAPWTFLGSGANSLLTLYGRRVQDVVAQRYPQLFPMPAPLAPPPEGSGMPAFEESAGPQEPPSAQLPPLPESVRPAPTESAGLEESPSARVTPVPASTALPPGAPALPPPSASGIPFPALHYVNNLITSVLVFPDSLAFLSLKDTLKSGEGFWQLRWNGRMSAAATGMLFVNLAIIGLGVGAGFQRLRWRGLLPLAVFLIYHASNALARTSGGRYLVPVDWILVCYYGLGLAELVRLGHFLFVPQVSAASTPRQALDAPKQSAWSIRTLLILPALLLIGGLIPLAGMLHPQRYPPQAAATAAASVGAYTASLGISSEDMAAFLSHPDAVLLNGRALYPRYYREGVGIEFSRSPFQGRGYPRTIFDHIGPRGMIYVILPGKAPETLPNASDAIVFGCRVHEQNIALVTALVVVLPQQQVALARSPATPFSCPAREPVCDDGGNCY